MDTKDTSVAAAAEETVKKPAPITSLAELHKLCAKTLTVKFDVGGGPCEIQIRRLTPAEQSKIAEIAEAVLPPITKGRTPEEDRVNTFDPDYRKRKSEALQEARAVGLYWGVPAFSQAKPGLTNPPEICAFVQSQTTEAVLSLLWNAIQDPELKGDLVNFT